MPREDIIMVCCSDIAGQVRGKGLLAADLDSGAQKGVGWTPTNIMITAHGPIAPGPWGALGDLMLVPDMSTLTRLDFEGDDRADRFVLADVTTPDGAPWACCLRDFARRGLAALETEFGLYLRAAFEHEFHYDGAEARPNSSYALDAFRRQGAFAETLMGMLSQAGLAPETFMPEYGPQQYEVTLAPAAGVRVADEAVILREVTRATAERMGARVSFTPMREAGSVGNGVHLHFSLEDIAGRPVSHDHEKPDGVSATAGAFLAGVLAKLPALTALTAAGTVSYLRLTPNRWSAAFNNLGRQDREAALRICPVFTAKDAQADAQFHFEYRAADSAASPYIVLGALTWAGLHGLRNELASPIATHADIGQMAEADRSALNIAPLPASLGEALYNLEADTFFAECMGPALHEAYIAHKRFEAKLVGGLTPAEQCERYYLAY